MHIKCVNECYSIMYNYFIMNNECKSIMYKWM